MSDTPQGGWWKAKDGKWYPPETHPDYATIATATVPSGPPAAGWWQANDGNWYPPETHPEHDPSADAGDEVVYDLTDRSSVASPSVTVPANGTSNGTSNGLTTNGHAAPVDVPPVDLPPVEPVEAEAPAPSAFAPIPEPEMPAPSAFAPIPEPEMPAPSAFAPIPEPEAPIAPTTTPSGGGLFNLTPDDTPSDGWGSPDTYVESTAEPAATPSTWGQVDDAVVVEPTTPVSGASPTDDPDAPLPGWRKGGDGHWYPPGQEPPAARANVFPATPRSADPAVAASAATASGSRRRLPLLLLAGAAVLALLVVGGLLLFGGGDDPEPAAVSAAPTTTTPTTTEAPAPTTTSTIAAVEPPSQVSGTGTAVVAVDRTVTEPYLALVTHDGAGSFSMSLLDANGEIVQQPMGEAASGDYLGVVPVNFVAGQPFSAVRVEGEGPWAVTFAVVDSAPVASTTPGSTYNGSGDQVVRFAAAEDVRIALACTNCDPSLSVVAFAGTGAPGQTLEVDGGTAVVPADTTYLQVVARGNPSLATPTWTLTPT